MEMDNFEAWNNLANCYVKLGQKERAWRVLQESVRCDFENWKVWDNLMVISVSIFIVICHQIYFSLARLTLEPSMMFSDRTTGFLTLNRATQTTRF